MNDPAVPLFLLLALAANLAWMGFMLRPRRPVAAAESYPPIPDAYKLLPPHRAILQRTGWLEYFLAQVDVVEYRGWPAMVWSPDGEEAIGFAHYADGKRIVYVALGDLDNVQAVCVLLHEAAHLSGIVQKEEYFAEAHAEAVAAQFVRDYQRVYYK